MCGCPGRGPYPAPARAGGRRQAPAARAIAPESTCGSKAPAPVPRTTGNRDRVTARTSRNDLNRVDTVPAKAAGPLSTRPAAPSVRRPAAVPGSPGSAPGGPSFGPSSRRRPLPPCRRPLCLRAITGPPGRHRCPRAVAAATPTPHPGSRPPPPRPRAAGGQAVLSPVVPVPVLVVPVPALVVRASPRLGLFRPVGGSVPVRPVRPVRPAGPWRRDRGDRRIGGPWETVARGDVTQGEPRVNSGGRPGMFEHLATMTESARR